MNKYLLLCFIMFGLSIGSALFTLENLLEGNSDKFLLGIMGVSASSIIGFISTQKAKEVEKKHG